jgi:ABC-type multidrug transport system fused ATPase/permease subunit
VVGYFLHVQLQLRAKEVGIEANSLIVQSNQKTIEVLFSYRESVVRNRRQFYVNEISKIRYSLGKVNAETSFQPFISKYVLEVTSVLGSLALASYEFETKNAVHAIAILALFMAATSRIAPAALRIQQGILLVKNSAGGSSSTFQVISELKNVKVSDGPVLNPDFKYDGFEAEIVADNVNFQYQNDSKFALQEIYFKIPAGSSAAIVGPSGSGKTTLIDLLLGVLEPQKGSISISNSSPNEAIIRWPGAISYVPQNVFIANATIRENVGLGYPTQFISEFRVKEALATAQLFDIVENFKEGIDAPVGENGAKISGGQRQRLGIARALFTSPKLLVLDEATSALDGQTEADLTKSIELMSGKVTVIVVAHRLSTVQKVDQVIYVNKGRVLATGKFDDVRKAIPDFDQQARLMGL